jgi:hypothetical protein
MAAAGTLVQMASHGGGPASLNGPEYFQVQPREPGRRAASEAVRRGGYDIGQLQERPIHLLTGFRLRNCGEAQRIQRARSRFEMAI